MTGTVSSKRYLKPVKLFVVGINRKFDAQWIRAIEVVLEPTPHPPLLRPLTESSEGELIIFSI